MPSAYENGMTAAYYWGSLPFIPIVIIVVFGLVASWAGAATRPAATGVGGSGRADSKRGSGRAEAKRLWMRGAFIWASRRTRTGQ